MSPVTLCCFGGVEGQIGGNQLLLSTKTSKLLLDFGVNLSRFGSYFKRIFSEPSSRQELIRANLIPNECADPSFASACIVSHAHTDHWRFINMIQSNPTVYCSSMTHRLITAIAGRRQRKAGLDNYSAINFSPLEFQKRVSLDDIEFEILPVDHSIAGASAFLIHTPEGAIAYSGDFRTHGRLQPPYHFWEAIKEDADTLIAFVCEGTNVGHLSVPYTEKDVERALQGIVEKTKKLLIVDISPEDVDRIRSIVNTAEMAKRKVVCTKRIIEVLETLAKEPQVHAPSLGLDVHKYEELKDDVGRDPSRFILCTSFYSEREIRELQPPPGSVYVLSSSEPFEEEREVDFQRLQNWLNILGIPILHVHSSGHASPLAIREITKILNPRCFLPIHSLYPEATANLVADLVPVLVPKRHSDYALA